MAHLPRMWLAAPLLLLMAFAPSQPTRVAKVVSFVMQREHITGLSIAVNRNGKILYARGFGRKDRTHRAPPDAYTVYPVGSILKQMIAARVLVALARRNIPTSAPLAQFLPDYSWASSVTIHDLLAQQSGIPPDTYHDFQRLSLHFAPGSSWEYSNANYIVLGKLLQRLTLKPWQSSIKNLSTKLGLISTHTQREPSAINRATGYRWSTHTWHVMPARWHEFSLISSAGALESNAIDLTTWLTALCRGDVLAAPQFAQMITNQPLLDGEASNYGYGFFLRRWSGVLVAEHKGNLDGFSSDDALVPQTGLSIAILTNEDSVDLAPLMHSIVDIFLSPRNMQHACV